MSQQPGAQGVADAVHDEDHSHKSTLDRLIYMANQIGWFFKSQPEATVVPGILDHIQHFWDPRMRAEIFSYIGEKGGEGRLEAPVLEALTQLKLAEESKRAKGSSDESTKVETGQQRTGEAPKDVTDEGRG